MSSSPPMTYSNAVIAHNSQRAQVDKRNMDIDDEMVKLQKLQLLVKRSELKKAKKKMKKAKKKRKKHSESDSSESSDERRKRKKKKKRMRSPSCSPPPSTSGGKLQSVSLRRPRRSSESSCSSMERTKRRRLSTSFVTTDRSPSPKRSLKARFSPLRSPGHHSRPSPPVRHVPPDSPYEYSHSRSDPDSYSRTRRYSSHASSAYSDYYDRGEKRPRETAGIVLVKRGRHRESLSPPAARAAPPDHYWDQDQLAGDEGELEDGELVDDYESPTNEDSYSTQPERDGNEGSPETSRKRIKEERNLTEEDIRRAIPRPMVKEENLCFVPVKTEKTETIKPKKKISPNPRFVLPVKRIQKQMKVLTKSMDEDTKDKFLSIIKVILRLRIKDMLQGKAYMDWKNIVKLYRERYDSEEDGELVASLANAMHDGAFRDFIPSDDEEQPKKEGPEDFTEFLPYVPNKKKSDDNKENEVNKNDAEDDIIILEKNVDVVDITDEEAQKLLDENTTKDDPESLNSNKEKFTEDMSLNIEAPQCQVKKEPSNDIPKISNKIASQSKSLDSNKEKCTEDMPLNIEAPQCQVKKEPSNDVPEISHKIASKSKSLDSNNEKCTEDMPLNNEAPQCQVKKEPLNDVPEISNKNSRRSKSRHSNKEKCTEDTPLNVAAPHCHVKKEPSKDVPEISNKISRQSKSLDSNKERCTKDMPQNIEAPQCHVKKEPSNDVPEISNKISRRSKSRKSNKEKFTEDTPLNVEAPQCHVKKEPSNAVPEISNKISRQSKSLDSNKEKCTKDMPQNIEAPQCQVKKEPSNDVPEITNKISSQSKSLDSNKEKCTEDMSLNIETPQCQEKKKPSNDVPEISNKISRRSKSRNSNKEKCTEDMPQNIVAPQCHVKKNPSNDVPEMSNKISSRSKPTEVNVTKTRNEDRSETPKTQNNIKDQICDTGIENTKETVCVEIERGCDNEIKKEKSIQEI